MQDWQKKKFARLYQQGDNGKALSLAEIAAKTHLELNHRHVMRALNSLGIDTSLSVAARQDILDGVTDRRDIFLSTRQAEALNRIGFPGLEKHLIKIFVVNAKGFDFEYLHPMEDSKSVSVRLTAKSVKVIAGIKDLVAKNTGKKAGTPVLIRFALEDAIANNFEDLAKPDLPPVEHNHFTPVGVSDRFCVALTPRIMEMIEQIKAPKGKYQEQELNGSSFIRDCIAKCDPATLLNFVETPSNASATPSGNKTLDVHSIFDNFNNGKEKRSADQVYDATPELHGVVTKNTFQNIVDTGKKDPAKQKKQIEYFIISKMGSTTKVEPKSGAKKVETKINPSKVKELKEKIASQKNAKSFLIGITEIGSNKLNDITAGLKLTRSAAIVAAVNQVCALNLQQELWAYTIPELPPDDIDDSEDIAQKIRSVRDRLGLSRRQLSEAIDCNFNIIAKLELRNGAVSKQWRDRVVNFVLELEKA